MLWYAIPSGYQNSHIWYKLWGLPLLTKTSDILFKLKFSQDPVAYVGHSSIIENMLREYKNILYKFPNSPPFTKVSNSLKLILIFVCMCVIKLFSAYVSRQYTWRMLIDFKAQLSSIATHFTCCMLFGCWHRMFGLCCSVETLSKNNSELFHHVIPKAIKTKSKQQQKCKIK